MAVVAAKAEFDELLDSDEKGAIDRGCAAQIKLDALSLALTQSSFPCHHFLKIKFGIVFTACQQGIDKIGIGSSCLLAGCTQRCSSWPEC